MAGILDSFIELFCLIVTCGFLVYCRFFFVFLKNHLFLLKDRKYSLFIFFLKQNFSQSKQNSQKLQWQRATRPLPINYITLCLCVFWWILLAAWFLNFPEFLSETREEVFFFTFFLSAKRNKKKEKKEREKEKEKKN